MRKLSEEQAIEASKLYLTGRSSVELGHLFGVSRGTICSRLRALGVAIRGTPAAEGRKRHGSTSTRPLRSQINKPLPFGGRAFRIDEATGCWVWLESTSAGYGSVFFGGQSMPAHRASWLMYRGPIPGDLCVLHSCDNPPCVNPEHLFLGTDNDNALDRARKNRGTKSRRGLPYGVQPDRHGNRYVARGYVGGRRYLGSFASVEEAAAVAAADKARALAALI